MAERKRADFVADAASRIIGRIVHLGMSELTRMEVIDFAVQVAEEAAGVLDDHGWFLDGEEA